MILVRLCLALFAASAAAGELERRVHADLERRGLGPDALLIPHNMVRHEIDTPRGTPPLVLELLGQPLATADTAALFARLVPEPPGPAEDLDFEGLLARYLSEIGTDPISGRFLESTVRFAQGLRAPGLRFPPPQRRETAIGTLVIGGPGPDRHGPQAALIVDPGGDDIYERAPAGARQFSVIVDLAGNDRYEGSDLADRGHAALVDLAGDDTYDMQSGLGAARGGVSLLLDAAGNDRYRVRSRGQGYAAAGGLGILWDMAGDDEYVAGGEPDAWGREAGLSFAQGAAAGERSTQAGGIGILRDDAGNDRYEAQMFAQGSGYYFALGLLWDRGGADRYRAVRYAQGSGVHQAIGILRDEGGDDGYALAGGVGQGVGHDMAHGLLVDLSGRDTYEARYLAQGSASSNGVGVLADLAGGGRWNMGPDASAWGEAQPARGLPSIGVLLHDAPPAAFTRPPLPAAARHERKPCPDIAPAQTAARDVAAALLAVGPGLATGKPEAAAYASLLRRLIDDPQGAMDEVRPDNFSMLWAFGETLHCALAAAPPEAAQAMWRAFERALDDPRTPLAGAIGRALRRRPAPPEAQARMLAALDRHASCAVRAEALLAWPTEARARARLGSACWREQAAALRVLPPDASPGASALPSFLPKP